MTTKDAPTGSTDPKKALRRRAETTARERAAPLPNAAETPSPEETGRMLHELRVHQIELEMQNEELRRTQAELAAARARYFDLYDLAPVGYCVVSEQGLIQETNLTAADLLGVTRSALVEKPISRFILADDQDIYYRHRKQLFETGEPQACELRMNKADGTQFWASLEGAPSKDDDGATTCRIMLSDITERKFRDDERELTARLVEMINEPGGFRECLAGLTGSLQEWSGCEAVGIRLNDGNDYPYFETRGFPPAFVRDESRLCAFGPDGKVLRDDLGAPVLECMCGNVLCGRFDPAKPFFTDHGSFWTNSTTALLADTSEADRQARTRNRCHGAGYESVALIPLRAGGQVFGLLQFNDPRPGRFTAALIGHFERLADSLAIALARYRATEALRESEERFTKAFQASPVAMAISRFDDGLLLDVNEMWLKTMGYGRDEVLGTTSADYGVWADLDQRLEFVERLCRDGAVTDFEAGFRTKSDVVRDVVLGGELIEFNGKSHMLLAFHDVTERNRAAQQITAQRKLLDTIIEAIPHGIFWKNRDRTYAGCNSVAARNWSLDRREDIVGKAVFDLALDRAEAENIDAMDRIVIEEGTALINFEDMHVAADGEVATHLSSKVPLKDTAGNVTGLVCLFYDITKQRLVEKQLRHAQKMAVVGQLAGGTAHDFNNLLQVIQSSLQMMERRIERGQDVSHLIEAALSAVSRGARLSQHLLSFSRQQALLSEAVDPNRLVEKTVELLGNTLGEDIGIDVHPENGVASLFVDPHGLENAILNIAFNARAAMPNGGRLTIATASKRLDEAIVTEEGVLPAGDYVEIAVTDTGCGMPPEVAARAFEPFFTTREVGEGSGLGLSMVYGFALQSNGHVALESEVGKGTTFRMIFPVIAAQSEAVPDTPENVADADSGNETILVVEDDPDVRCAVVRALESLGYAVSEAENGVEALAILDREPGLDLLFTDVVMPMGMNGLELAQEAIRKHPRLKVVLTSGYPERKLGESRLPESGFALLAKPYSNVELAATLRSALADLE